MINLREKIKSFLDENIKKKNSIAVSTTRLILAALKDRDIESRIKNKSGLIDDSEIFNMFQSMIKQRQESVKIYAEAGRHELKNRELSEIEIIESFLPTQIKGEELNKIIDKICNEIQATNIKDLGRLMTILKEKYPGQLDLKMAVEYGKSILTR